MAVLLYIRNTQATDIQGMVAVADWVVGREMVGHGSNINNPSLLSSSELHHQPAKTVILCSRSVSQFYAPAAVKERFKYNRYIPDY